MKQKPNMLGFLIMIIILSVLASAEEFTEYPNSFTSSGHHRIRVADNYAMAMNRTNGQISFYNSTEWVTISAPAGLNAGNPKLLSMDKSTDKNFYFLYGNTSSNGKNYEIWQYTPNVTLNCPSCWSLAESGVTPYRMASLYSADVLEKGFACNQKGQGYVSGTNDAECYLTLNATVPVFPLLDASSLPTPYCESGGGLSFDNSKLHLACYDSGVYSYNVVIYRYDSGVTWTLLSNKVTSDDFPYIASYNSAGTVSTFVDVFPFTYNTSSSIFSKQSTTTNWGFEGVAPKFDPDNNANVYYSSYSLGLQSLYKWNYFTPSLNRTYVQSNPIFTTTYYLNDLDFDYDTGAGWLAGTQGKMFQYDTEAVSSGAYIVTASVNPNPTIYGGVATFYATPQNQDLAGTTSVTVAIYQNQSSTLPLYLFSMIGDPYIPSGTQVSNTLSGDAWTNFEPNHVYNVRMVANDTNSRLSDVSQLSWTVTTNSTSNTTSYNISQYESFNANIESIRAVLALGQDDAYAVGVNSTGGIVVLSYDSTNPNAITRKEKGVITSGADFGTSIGIGTNNLYLGTNDEIYEFTNAQSGDATNLVQNETSTGFGILSADYVYHVTGLSDLQAVLCRKGITVDDLRIYNSTAKDASQTISVNPCKTAYVIGSSVVVHRGASNIEIYNLTTQSLSATITGISTYPAGADHDRISHYNNVMFAITATNKISKYNITNLLSPVKVADCYSLSGEPVSIEALSENEVIIGTSAPSLRVCDFSNQNTYEPSASGYVAGLLKTYPSSSYYPYEIERMGTAGKFHVAEDASYGVYFYQKAQVIEAENQPATINQVSLSTTNPCINQPVFVDIDATDPEGDDLTYDWDCNGIKALMTNNYLINSFSCSYTTTGQKFIKTWVKDSGTQTPVLTSKNVLVSNCTATPQLQYKVLDANTGNPVADVLVTVDGVGTTTTDSLGNANIDVPTTTSYLVSFALQGYFTKTGYSTSSNSRVIVYLQSTTEVGATLTVTVLDENSNALGGALVAITNPVTGESKNVLSDAQGKAILINMFTGNNMILGVSSEGYITSQTYISISANEQATETIQLEKKLEAGQTIGNNRGCVDRIEGVDLCSPLNITLNGDFCDIDSDCLTDECLPHPDGIQGKCSSFNWSLCDRDNRKRDNGCYASYMSQGVFSGITGWMLENFLYVLVLAVFLIVFVIIMASLRRK
jgi:hypothetical protein